MKRILYILAVFSVSLLLVLSMLVAALMSDKVETSAVGLVTAELSRALGTEARVGAIEYRFPARIAIKDVFIEDRARDTLVYIGEVYAHFRPLPLHRGEIHFSHVRLEDVVAKAYRMPDSTWNYALFKLPAREEKDEDDPFESLLSVRDIQLNNIRVRYEDYEAYLEHSEMDLHHLSESELDAQIGELRGTLRRGSTQVKPTTRSGTDLLAIRSFRARLILNDTLLAMPTMSAQLPHSRLDVSGIEVRFPAGDTLYLSKSAHDITFALDFHEAKLVPADLSLFNPRVQHLTRPVTLNGAVGGTLDSLYFDDIAVRYDGRTVLEGSMCAIGLPDLDNPFVRANLTSLTTNAVYLQDFLSRLYGRPIKLPQQVHRLGMIHYRGLAEGRLHDLTLHGAFRTALGAISTDGSFRSDSLFEHMTYDARIVGRRFRVGRLLGHAPLKSATLDFRSKGRIDEGEVRGHIRAHLREVTYNEYTYSDLNINGKYEPQRYEGEFGIDDPHLSVHFDGVVDLKDVNPEINFNLRCEHFDSEPLGNAKLGSSLQTRFSMAIDMNGVETDKMSGYMVIDSLFIATSRDSLLMEQMTLLVDAQEGKRKNIELKSDFGSARMKGQFRYNDLAPAFQAMMHHYLPSAVPAPNKRWGSVVFSVEANGERLRDIQRLYIAPFTLSDHPSMWADARLVPGREPKIGFQFYAPGVRAASTPIHDLTVTLNTVDTLQHEGANGSGLAFSISAEAMKMQTVLSSLAFQDTLLTHLTLRQQEDIDAELPEGWRNLSPRELQRALSSDLSFRQRQHALLTAQRAGNYGGDIHLATHFARYAGKPLIEWHFMPGTLLLKDSVYTIGESRITYCAADTTLLVDHFLFEGNGQHLRAHGLASTHATDTLAVDLQKVDASYVVPFILPVQTIMFNGLLTGRANIASTLKKPVIETQIHIDSMGLNNCYFGDAEVDLSIKDSLYFHADVYKYVKRQRSAIATPKTVVDLEGKALFDGSGVWELNMETDSVPLAFINHWTASVLRDLKGNATGKVVVGGRQGLVYVLVRAAAQNAYLTLPWTGATYVIPEDTIVLDTTTIEFPHVRLQDLEGNKVEFNGTIYHDQFKDFMLDLHVDAHDALVFDSEKKGELLRGHVYADGHIDVTGDESDLMIDAEAVTRKNSRFRLSIDNVSSASSSNFIHFIEKVDSAALLNVVETDLDNIDIKEVIQVDTIYKRSGRCILRLNVEVNPLLQFQLVLSERNGDMIQARGSGALQVEYDTESGEVRLVGTYDIERGTLGYTIANVIRKEFTIGEGSTISFSGNASNPTLDVVAKYRVTANLRDLFGEDVEQLTTGRTNIPVMTCLHMSGPLNNPTLSFSLEFPQSDQGIQQQVRQIINTDEMLMRQVIYLLVFGRFFTPDNASVDQTSTLNSTYSLLSSTITSQINSWLSKLTNMVTVGVAIRQEGEGADASREYEAQFQLRPVDRLIINGNVGYRYNDISNQPFFGDLDVEILLTPDGQWRMKGYTHTVDKYTLRQASTIQGFGFAWKKDFNWPSLKRKDQKEREKTEKAEKKEKTKKSKKK